MRQPIPKQWQQAVPGDRRDRRDRRSIAGATTAAPPAACTVTRAFGSIADDKVVYRLTDAGTNIVTLDTFSLNFPSSYVSVKEVRLGGSSIFKSSASVPAVPSGATIGSWTNPDATKRRLNPGATKDLEVMFSKKSPKASCPTGSCFGGTASFSPGCQLTFGP